ncbi:MAG: FAD-dependent oxidoreductase, partial [Chloroflexota bacterium]
MVKKIKIKYLVIGNSAGGIGAAEAIRQADRAGTLAIVSDEPYPAYSRPLIAEYLATGCSLERMLYRPADFYQQHHIETYLGSEVARLDLGQHLAEVADGPVITWEKLLLATGGLPIVPPMDGIGLGGVFTFTRLDDARAISQYLYRVRRAVVIGGGLIGVSVTEALSKRQVAVTVVEMKARLLNMMLDEETSAREEAALRQAGVGLVTGHTVAAINGGPGGDKVAGVTLDDGRRLPSELVVVAIGVRPRAGLAQGTDIKLNRGIVVDHHMATSYPGVYACGDVAEAPDFVYSECRLTPVWPNAYLGGRVAGFNMAGVATVYPGGTALNSLKYFGQDVISAGLVTPPDPSYETISHRYNGS